MALRSIFLNYIMAVYSEKTLTIRCTICLHACEHRCTFLDTLSDLRAGYSINVYSPEEKSAANAFVLTNTMLIHKRCPKGIPDYNY